MAGFTKKQSDLAFRTYRKYLRRRATINEVLDSLEPCVSVWGLYFARKKWGKRVSLEWEEAIHNGRLGVWSSIKRKIVPSSNEKDFLDYTRKIIYRQVRKHWDELRKGKFSIPEKFLYDLYLLSIRDSSPEMELFTDDISQIVRKGVLNRIQERFPLVSVGAASYVMDRILNGDCVSKSWLVRQYYIPEPQFFIESVLLAFRMFICSLYEDVYPLSKSLRGTPYESFIEKNM